LTFILRIVLILFIFAFVVYVIKAIARLWFQMRGTVKEVQKLREEVKGRPVAGAEMVKCIICGAFVTSREAITISARNRAQVFCSQDCMRLHVAK
jgi:hypothetical protein